jgi:RNA 2',3'-cyclic 3'-phosphodiesterase
MRIFFAVPVAATAAAALSALCARLQTQRGWRWVPQGNWHITLAFLGATDEAKIPALRELGQQAANSVAKGSLALTRFEWWPVAKRPHLLVAAADPTEPLLSLHEILLDGLAQAGIEVDARPLRPHLTLVRLQRDAEAVQPVLPECCIDVPVERLVLYSSEPGGHGSIYRELWQQSLQSR